MSNVQTSFVCAISRNSPKNWTLCKESGTYGISGHSRPSNVKKDDALFVWLGGRGYAAELIVTGDPRPPESRDETPWPGGLYQYGFIIPFSIVLEVARPVNFPFEGQRQSKTGVTKAGLQRSIALLTTDAAEVIRQALREEIANAAQ